MSRPERIAFLLSNLEDARNGIRDSGGVEAGEHLPLMCRVWNHPSFQELERLLPLLRSERRRLAWHLAKTYFAPRRRVLECPRCRRTVEV